MKYVYIKGSSAYFMEQHSQYKPFHHESSILGLYVPSQEIAYIFMTEILVNAKLLWLMTQNDEFHRPKGLIKLGMRLRRLVEYHEYAHHLQHQKKLLTKGNSKHNEHVADRYAILRYHQDYHRAPGFQFDRSRIKPPTLFQKLTTLVEEVINYIDATWVDIKLTMGVL